MIKFYIRRIKNGLMTIKDVPAYWRDRVQAELEKEAESVN